MSRKPVDMRTKRRPPRVDALAVLPVFFRLEGRRVVLAGGSDAAAWKGELLAAAGAEVHVYAEHLGDGFAALIEKGSVKGRFVHHARPWDGDVIKGAALAVADAVTQGEARAFFCAAKAVGVPVNVIDNPPFCEFQFGSIVNRSPVVIGISTNGVAPILGQAIRRRIETLLPQSLRDWAAWAGRVRGAVLQRLAAGQQRRSFWERFCDLAFSAKALPDVADEELLEAVIADAEDGARGRVTVVGAGPGDAEHLTLKAMRTLQSADVILFDEGIQDGVLELSRREAKRLLVGKKPGAHAGTRDEIDDLMIGLAGRGKHVVWLKAGTPSLASGLGDALGKLSQSGLETAIVPGVGAEPELVPSDRLQPASHGKQWQGHIPYRAAGRGS